MPPESTRLTTRSERQTLASAIRSRISHWDLQITIIPQRQESVTNYLNLAAIRQGICLKRVCRMYHQTSLSQRWSPPSSLELTRTLMANRHGQRTQNWVITMISQKQAFSLSHWVPV